MVVVNEEQTYIWISLLYRQRYINYSGLVVQRIVMQSIQGIHFGRIEQEEDKFRIMQQKKDNVILEINHDHILNATGKKQDIVITLQEKEGRKEEKGDTKKKEGQYLEEIRLAVETPENVDDKINYAQKYLDNITREIVVAVEDVNIIVPRGKYTMNFYTNHLGLHGSTFSHKVKYADITKGFLLPSSNQISVFIVLALNKPVTLGLTPHSYLVIQVAKETRVEKDIEVNKKVLEDAQEDQIADSLKSKYSGNLIQILIHLMTNLMGRGLVQPDKSFRSVKGQPCVRGSIKAQSGWLYLLKNSLIFIPKPAFHFRTAQISKVDLLRAGTSSRRFDLRLNIIGTMKTMEVSGIQNQQQEKIVEYFKSKDVEVSGQPKTNKIVEEDDEESYNEEEDEDFNEADFKEEGSQSSQAEFGEEEETPEQKEPVSKKKQKREK